MCPQHPGLDSQLLVTIKADNLMANDASNASLFSLIEIAQQLQHLPPLSYAVQQHADAWAEISLCESHGIRETLPALANNSELIQVTRKTPTAVTSGLIVWLLQLDQMTRTQFLVSKSTKQQSEVALSDVLHHLVSQKNTSLGKHEG